VEIIHGATDEVPKKGVGPDGMARMPVKQDILGFYKRLEVFPR
jgi:hypothetical protein